VPILGYGEILLNDFGPGDNRRARIEQIVQAGLRARDLVRQLLAFSRKQNLEYHPVDMNAAIRGFEKLLRSVIREDINWSSSFRRTSGP
jgi:signal transduction histidine kinase